MAGTLKMYAVVEFEDGLSVVPKNWLTEDLTEAFWPMYTNTARHDKAVKRMQEPESTWSKCSIRKLYGTYLDYNVARQKLKRAEEESDLTSNTEKDESRKRSRKDRAKKDRNSSTSSNDNELSDDSSICENMPKAPKRCFSNESFQTEVTHGTKTKNAQKNPPRGVSSGRIRPGGSRNHQTQEEEVDDPVYIERDKRDYEDNDVLSSPNLTSNNDQYTSFDDRSYDKRQRTKKMENTASNKQYNVGKNDFRPPSVVSSGRIIPGGSRNHQTQGEEVNDPVLTEMSEIMTIM